jgi:hypothetical protein
MESTLAVDELRVKHLSDDVAIVHASMTLIGQTAIAAIKRPGTRKSIFSFVIHKVGARWTCASAHNTDGVPDMETNFSTTTESFGRRITAAAGCPKSVTLRHRCQRRYTRSVVPRHQPCEAINDVYAVCL